MVLFVEGTSRWCWCHPFKNKSAHHITSVVEKFVKAIDERITCLVTDAGKEWQAYHSSQRSMDLCGRGRKDDWT